jgi:hypothetical protein
MKTRGKNIQHCIITYINYSQNSINWTICVWNGQVYKLSFQTWFYICSSIYASFKLFQCSIQDEIRKIK